MLFLLVGGGSRVVYDVTATVQLTAEAAQRALGEWGAGEHPPVARLVRYVSILIRVLSMSRGGWKRGSRLGVGGFVEWLFRRSDDGL